LNILNKKVLIITYYWPPVGGSGVQRWLKMSRYLQSFGWEPVIYTPENPSFGTIDKSLLKDVPPDIEVIQLPIWEPYQLFAGIKGKKGMITASDIRIREKKTILDKIFLWLRGNFFIPDPRVFWVKPSVKFLPDIIQSNKIDAVITTGPPHSLHLIGRRLKKKAGIKWIADFRDPWTQWDLYEEFPMTRWARHLQKKLERKVLQEADEVFTNNDFVRTQFEEIAGRTVKVISNGYDEADFKDFQKKDTEKFTIRHIGIIDEMRDPVNFIKALKLFIKDHPDDELKVEFIGNVAETFRNKVVNDDKLSQYIQFKSHQPHEEIIKLYEKTDVLLLVLANTKNAAGNTPGKIYEYLASGARILALGPTEGEVADILRHTESGKIAAHHDTPQIKAILEGFFNAYTQNAIHENKHVEEYSRRAQAGKVAEILNNYISG
jgi:glycosyltransferase involved in cell wall biosynthesis